MKGNLMLNNHSRIKILSVFILGLAIFSYVSIAQIEKGPYLQSPTKSGITICWVSAENGYGEVRFGIDSNLNRNVFSDKKTTYHQLTLDSLNPQTDYIYQVLGAGYMSESYHFKTAPYDTTAFTFAVLGDTRSGHDAHSKIVQAIIKLNPDFVLNTGDLVANGGSKSEWDKFFEINRDLMNNIPYYPVLGNHEGNSENFFNYFALPDKERYYSFPWSVARFIALDSNKPYEESEEQKTFLSNALVSIDSSKFVFVFYHHPAYSSVNKRREERGKNRHHFLDIFQKRKPDIVFNGHDHNYQRYLVNGVNYVIAGGGGAPLYEIENQDNGFVKGFSDYSYCILNVNKKNIKMEVYDLNGNVIDSLEIKK
jgi:predicted phosphodiesterase